MTSDIRAESTSTPSPSRAPDWYRGNIQTLLPSSNSLHFSYSSSHSQSHQHSHPQQPHESSPLYRSSSISSLSSAYSDCSTESSSSTDSSSPDEGYPIVSILKKPRQRFRNEGAQQQLSNPNHAHESGDHGNHDEGNANADEQTERQEGEDDDEDCWEDEESDCDIVFERHVTFDDPLATDLVSGCPVSPSPRSRTEWTAMRARACLERMRVAWKSQGDTEEDEEGEAQEGRQNGHEETNDIPLAGITLAEELENHGFFGEGGFEIVRVETEAGDVHTTRGHNNDRRQEESWQGEGRKGERKIDADVDDLVHGLVDRVVCLLERNE
ncbi:hypothetical protein GQX73_g7270 [Xylaria multiplex]|uniref:Uncharacterized protein n=1 Tax=Xylaria multiplex TaxID=323545 RepID=A0A7C8IRG1_9PEZI|nr:hypothetical protein GQX73_g7270 [Xylaria multiplex]